MGARIHYDCDFGSSRAKRQYSKIASYAQGNEHCFSCAEDEKCGRVDISVLNQEAAKSERSDRRTPHILSHEWTEPCMKSKSKRSRMADICIGQSIHQRKILEALTPVPCQYHRSFKGSSCSDTYSFRPYQTSSWHTSLDGSIQHSRAMTSSLYLNSIEPPPSVSNPFPIPITAQSPQQEAHSTWPEDQDAESGRYSRIAALLSSLDSCEGLKDNWAGTDSGFHKNSGSHLDGVVGDDAAIALLFKYTHVSGGGP